LLQVFFHESFSPKPLKITLGSFRIFLNFAEIFASQGAPPVSTTPVANFATSISDNKGKSVLLTLVANNWNNISLLTLKVNLKEKI
jgi:hypothetical protein